MLKDIGVALEEYQTKYRRSDVPSLRPSGVYSLFPEETGRPTDLCWPAKYPHCEKKGVYFIFGKTGRLLYIGKASLTSLGDRVGSYFRYADDKKTCKIKGTWKDSPAFLATVAVPDDMPFEAAALEEFLIGRLKPSENTVGMDRERFAMNL